MNPIPALLLPALLLPSAAAQTIVQNTRLRSSVSIPTVNWSAGNTGYRTATNRYLIQTLGSGGLAIVDTTNPASAFVVRVVQSNMGRS